MQEALELVDSKQIKAIHSECKKLLSLWVTSRSESIHCECKKDKRREEFRRILKGFFLL
jgi:hypothetical protein